MCLLLLFVAVDVIGNGAYIIGATIIFIVPVSACAINCRFASGTKKYTYSVGPRKRQQRKILLPSRVRERMSCFRLQIISRFLLSLQVVRMPLPMYW